MKSPLFSALIVSLLASCDASDNSLRLINPDIYGDFVSECRYDGTDQRYRSEFYRFTDDRLTIDNYSYVDKLCAETIRTTRVIYAARYFRDSQVDTILGDATMAEFIYSEATINDQPHNVDADNIFMVMLSEGDRLYYDTYETQEMFPEDGDRPSAIDPSKWLTRID